MTSSEIPNYALTSYSFTFVGFDTSSSVLEDKSTSITSTRSTTRVSSITDESATSTDSPASSITSVTDVSSTSSATPSASPSTLIPITSVAAQVSSASTATSTAAVAALSTTSHSHEISAGAIAAAVIVPLVVIGAIIAGLLLFRRKRRTSNRATTSTSSSFDNGRTFRDAEKEDHYASTYIADKEEFNASRAVSRNEGPYAIPPQHARRTSMPRQSGGSAFRPASRMTERASMSTIKTTTTVADHPPMLPPVDTSFSFVHSVGNDSLKGTATAGVLTRGGSTSTSSTNVDPFSTPSPSSPHSRHNSSVLTRSESGVSRADHYQSQLATHAEAAMPVFEWRRASASPTSSPLTREAPAFPPSAAINTSDLLRRPSMNERAISNTSANTVISTHPSITPSTAAEFDYNDAVGDYAEIMEPSVAEAIAVPLHRAHLGGGGRASVIDLNATSTAAGRYGSGSSWATSTSDLGR